MQILLKYFLIKGKISWFVQEVSIEGLKSIQFLLRKPKDRTCKLRYVNKNKFKWYDVMQK